MIERMFYSTKFLLEKILQVLWWIITRWEIKSIENNFHRITPQYFPFIYQSEIFPSIRWYSIRLTNNHDIFPWFFLASDETYFLSICMCAHILSMECIAMWKRVMSEWREQRAENENTVIRSEDGKGHIKMGNLLVRSDIRAPQSNFNTTYKAIRHPHFGRWAYQSSNKFKKQSRRANRRVSLFWSNHVANHVQFWCFHCFVAAASIFYINSLLPSQSSCLAKILNQNIKSKCTVNQTSMSDGSVIWCYLHSNSIANFVPLSSTETINQVDFIFHLMKKWWGSSKENLMPLPLLTKVYIVYCLNNFDLHVVSDLKYWSWNIFVINAFALLVVLQFQHCLFISE